MRRNGLDRGRGKRGGEFTGGEEMRATGGEYVYAQLTDLVTDLNRT